MNNVKKSIGWCDWTINPVKGICPRFRLCLDNRGEPYCYAGKGYKRNLNATFKDKTIRYDDSVWSSYNKAKSGSRIFIGSTIDLFHDKTIQYWPEIAKNLRHDLINIFLTKCPENLPKEWPDNCWVGVSATDYKAFSKARWYLSNIKSKIKLISFEPLLGEMRDSNGFPLRPELLREAGINWFIIGLQTPYSPKTAPKIEWVKKIIEAADKAKIPVFLKDNLKPILKPEEFGVKRSEYDLRQEFPNLAFRQLEK